MPDRVLIPEYSSYRLVFNLKRTSSESLKEERPAFFYDADFIDKVIKDGYVAASERMKHPTRFSDDKKIDMLVKDMFNLSGGSSCWYNGETETARFVKTADKAPVEEGELAEGKIPVSDEIWSKALLINSNLANYRHESAERYQRECDDGSTIKDHVFFSADTVWVNVEGDATGSGKNEVLLTLPLVRDGGVFRRIIEPPYNPDFAMDLHFRFGPEIDKITDNWALQWRINTLVRPSPEEVFILCGEPGRPFKEVPSHEFWESNYSRTGDQLIRGLVKIQNHLNNPGMSDEEYLSLLKR